MFIVQATGLLIIIFLQSDLNIITVWMMGADLSTICVKEAKLEAWLDYTI
jgi:hypothetical protein